jgi:putative cell wall-binding protein
MVVASAGSASAAATPVAGTYQLTSTATQTVIYPGAAGQAAGDVEYWTSNNWTTNATATYTIAGNNCSTTAGIAAAVGFSAAPTTAVSGPFVQATGAAGTATKPAVTGALSSSTPACATAGIKDVFTVTFPSPAAPAPSSDVFSLTLSGIKYTVGSAAGSAPGTAVNLGLVTAGGLTAAAPAAVSNAEVSTAKFSVGTPAVATPGSTGVALPTATFTEVVPGALGTPGSRQWFHLATSAWGGGNVLDTTVTPTITLPTGWAVATGTLSVSATDVTFYVTVPATLWTSPATIAISGLKAAFATADAFDITGRSAIDGGGDPVIGTAQTVAVTVAQTRVGGSDRFATAAALFSGTKAILASGMNFPDALSANYLANVQGAKTLLTFPTTLPSVTLNKLISSNVTTVYIVGGPGAVSNAVENQIAATHVGNVPTNAFINVVRIAGLDRYATNLAVNEYSFATHSTAIVATGANFADALAVGPAVAGKGLPLILTATASLSATAAQQLTDMGVTNVVIVGGTGAVSSAVETAIKGMGITTTRLAGTDRTQTAAAIATWETDTVANGGLAFTGVATVHIANGANFPDALAAGPVAGAA